MISRRAIFLSTIVLSSVAAVAAVVHTHNPWIGIAIFLPFHITFFCTLLSPYSQWLGPVVTRFRTSRKEVWLTIDDGPGPGETEKILDVLDRFEARATFFLIGERTDANPQLVREISHRGHSIGNHTWSHPQATWWASPRFRVEREISRWIDHVGNQAEAEPPLFRSPVGMKPLGLHPVLARHGLPLISWSVRGRDGIRCDLEQVFERIRNRVEPGAIILIHEGRGHAPELLERLLSWLTEEGYRCTLPPASSFVCGGRR